MIIINRGFLIMMALMEAGLGFKLSACLVIFIPLQETPFLLKVKSLF